VTCQYSISELAERLSARLVGNPQAIITGVATLEAAREDHASFLATPYLAHSRYDKLMESSSAGVVVIGEGHELPAGKNFLVVKDPSRSFQVLVELFMGIASYTGFTGIHPTCCIHPEAQVSPDAELGPYVVVDARAKIGAKTKIGAHSYIGLECEIGADCTIYPQVTIRERCHIGNRVVIQPGAVIGGCGFGFTTDARGRHTKLNQVGRVVIEDDVEIGANTTVDRARFEVTRIGEGTKIDNLVQIAHGVKLGKHNLIVGQVGIAGSTETGNHVVLGGKVAVNGHIKIADGVIVTACSGVSKSLLEPGKYGGAPCLPLGTYNRNAVLLQNIQKIVEEQKELKKKLEELSCEKKEILQ
jgi:UDP-3-O-[3-hydroxymyristoyl] glucosamine N-acyltransferase